MQEWARVPLVDCGVSCRETDAELHMLICGMNDIHNTCWYVFLLFILFIISLADDLLFGL